MNTAAVWSNNLLAYSVQVLALVAAGAVLPWLLRVHQPWAQLIWFRLLLFICLLLPAIQPWRRPVVVVTTAAPVIPATGAPALPAAPAGPPVRWEEAALKLAIAGAALRLLWLLMGMCRLRRLRASCTPLYPLPQAIEAARQRVGAVAEVATSEFVNGPVTFGLRRSVVLLPASFLDQPGDAQYGIACHEFLHVRRRDWTYTVSEEFAGALLWFHPAVWWLLGQIRLVREQVVDHEVVALSEGREAYLEALLAMGSAPPQPDLAPAAPFLRRRQLSSRIQSLLKEVTMSKGKLVSCYVLTVAAALATAWFAAVSFPLEASPLVQARQSTASEGVIRVELAPNLSEPLRSNLRARLAAFQGQPYTPESREEILKAAQEVDSTARIMVMSRSETAEGWLVTTFIIAPVAARVTAPTDFPPSSGKRIAVDGIVQQSKLINQPKPQYPPLARQARIQGTVRFSAVIDKDGRVTNLTLVSGHPLLAPAAQDAVRQWVYQPTLLNGQPVEVMTEIDVNFTLAGDTPPPAQ